MASRIQDTHPEHLLLAAAIALGPFREHRDYSLGFAILWLSLHWVRALWATRHVTHPGLKTLIPGIALGLLLIQSRMLLTMEDHEGPTRYLIIASALLIGHKLSLTNWKSLLQWITAGALAAETILYLNWSIGGFASLYYTNKDALGEGFGGINMLGTVLATFTTCSAYSLRISKTLLPRLMACLTLFTSYSLCLASESRLSAITPLLAIFFSWVLSEGWPKARRLRPSIKIPVLCAISSIPTIAIWNLAISPDLARGMAADNERLQIWKCSISNSLLAGNNRIAYGNGFDWTSIREACGHWQAHSSYIHFLSMHGLLGLISLLVIALIILKGIRTHLHHRSFPRSLWHSSWGEVSLGCIFIVMLTGTTTTTYLGGYLNPLLIGLMLSTALAPLPGCDSDPGPCQGEARINTH